MTLTVPINREGSVIRLIVGIIKARGLIWMGILLMV